MNLSKQSFFPTLFLMGSIMMIGCTDNNYDFNDVDTTIGIGGDSIFIPVSSTDTIKLDDILKLEHDGCVVVEDNGNYLFSKKGDDVSPAHPYINKVVVAKQQSSTFSLQLDAESIYRARASRADASTKIKASGKVWSFSYEGQKPTDVKDITSATIDGKVVLTADLSNVSSVLNSIDMFVINMPEYMSLGDVKSLNGNGTVVVNGSKVTISNISTSKKIDISIPVSSLVFKSTPNGSLTIKDNKIEMTGDAIVEMVATDINVSSLPTSLPSIDVALAMDNFEITGADGRFSPKISLENLGSVDITGIPNFLTDGNVVVDLYNPQIVVTINNDMDVPGFIIGTLTSRKGEKTLSTIIIPNLPVNADGVSKICICRKAEDIDASQFTYVREVDNLSDLIKTVPDKIFFDAEATADDSKVCHFELGKTYEIKPSYSVAAPIAFEKDAQIVYKDSIDNINDDVKDIELSDNGCLRVTANIENKVPVNLKVSADAVGVDGKIISKDEIDIDVQNVIEASEDGRVSKFTPLTIVVKQKKSGAMKKLDKICFTISGKSTSDDGKNSVVGQVLNAKNHFLIVRDIKVALVGKAIANFN